MSNRVTPPVTQSHTSRAPPLHVSQEPKPLISHGCILLPVFFGIWWIYFRKKATSTFQKVMVRNSTEEEFRMDAAGARLDEDQFTTWEDVNESPASVRFVRWIKTQDISRGSVKRRAQVKQSTIRTMKIASQNPALVEPIIVDSIEEEACQASATYDAYPLPQSAESENRWQCLMNDISGEEGIELCSIDNIQSHEEESPQPSATVPDASNTMV